MKSDNDIAQDLKDIDQQTVDVVCDLLRQYSTKTSMYLANMVASVCDVDVDEMLTDTKHLRKTGTKRKFTVGSIGYCISKMSMMVESEPIWVKRWTIIKRVIKAILDNGSLTTEKLPTTITLKVVPPRGVDVKLQLIQ